MSNSKSRPGISRVALAAAVSGAIALAACGGGNDDVPPAAPAPVAPAPGPTVAVPASAMSSVAGLIAYLQILTAIQDDTLLPIDVSTTVLVTDDMALPTPI